MQCAYPTSRILDTQPGGAAEFRGSCGDKHFGVADLKDPEILSIFGRANRAVSPDHMQ